MRLWRGRDGFSVDFEFSCAIPYSEEGLQFDRSQAIWISSSVCIFQICGFFCQENFPLVTLVIRLPINFIFTGSTLVINDKRLSVKSSFSEVLFISWEKSSCLLRCMLYKTFEVLEDNPKWNNEISVTWGLQMPQRVSFNSLMADFTIFSIRTFRFTNCSSWKRRQRFLNSHAFY